MRLGKYSRLIGAGVGLSLLASVLCGYYDGNQELVETTYTVKKGDTLRGISEAYLPLNTGGRRYILEFEQGIREINPELWHTVTIQPGQVIKINYWVKK